MTQPGPERRSGELSSAVILLLAIYSLMNLLGALWVTPDRGSDFLAFYRSGLSWSAGLPAYRVPAGEIPNLTPPVLLPVFWLFSRLPFHAAHALWTGVSIGCVALVARTVSRRAAIPAWQVGLLGVGTAPGGVALGLGQVGFVLLVAITWSWDAAHHGRWTRSGMWLGFLCIVKPYFGLFAIWLVWRNRWLGATSLGAVWLVGMVLSVLVAGPSQFRDWLGSLTGIAWYSNIYNVGFAGVGARLFAQRVDTGATLWTPLLVSKPFEIAIDAALICAIAVVAVRGLMKHPGDTDREFSLLAVASLLLSPLAWVHYLPAVLGPVVCGGRRSPWAGRTLVLALFPYQVLLNQAYGRAGTVFVGQWSFLMAAMTLLAVASAKQPAVTSAESVPLRIGEARRPGQELAAHE